jgi:tyrosinase
MISRRRFLQSTVSLALVPLLPRVALSADLRVRPSWELFCTTPGFQTFCNAIAAMKANKNSADPNAWAYWVQTHKSYCPHGVKYFLAWHRGFIHRFEAQLQQVSGDPTLVLPYWNYYDHPTVPPEFLDPASPLYRSDRTSTDVTGALSFDAFADTVIFFPRGKTDAFEPIVESRPHNRVHNLIGGALSQVSVSPRDPLFWVHHANIDRLWVAWLAADNGRRQPATTATYWTGSFTYGAGVATMPRVWTASTTTYLGYQYDNELMPVAAPAPTTLAAASAMGVAGGTADTLPVRPASIPGPVLGASRPLALDEHSISVDFPLTAQDANTIRSLLLRPTADATASTQPDALRLVLDGVHLTGLGQKGGYLYDVYVNLPTQAGLAGAKRDYLLGSLGAFEISTAQMQASMGGMPGMPANHGGRVRLEFPLTDALKRVWPSQLDTLTVSFVRVDGSRHPAKGQVITVDAMSLQAGSVR